MKERKSTSQNLPLPNEFTILFTNSQKSRVTVAYYDEKDHDLYTGSGGVSILSILENLKSKQQDKVLVPYLKHILLIEKLTEIKVRN